jgi:hypothetical protein
MQQRAFFLVAVLAIFATTGGGAAAQPGPPPDPQLTLTLGSVTCNPGGSAGLSSEGTATVTDGVLTEFGLGATELGTIPPNHIPYEPIWGVASWHHSESWDGRSGPMQMTRTLDTTDSTTYDFRYWLQDIWTASTSGSWWSVSLHASAQAERGPGWTNDHTDGYINCGAAEPEFVPASELDPITYCHEETGGTAECYGG